MLKTDLLQQIEDVAIYGDDKSYYTFYPLPQSPRFRLADGKPSFKFIKYRELRKEGDDLFGGVCAFDTEFVVAPEKLEAITLKLQAQVDDHYKNKLGGADQPPAVVFAPLTYTGGTVQLNISDGGGVLIESVRSGNTPSLYGNNVATFWIELTKAGATVFEAAMRGEGGFIEVVYNMTVMAKLPPITARGWFHASRFYSFFQEISGDRYTETQTQSYFFGLFKKSKTIRDYSLKEDLNEYMSKYEAMGTEFNFIGDPSMSGDDRIRFEESVRSTLMRQLDDAVERNLLQEIERIVPDPQNRELIIDKGWNNFRETLRNTQISDVNITFTENRVIEWNIAPQGMLPNITTMRDRDGRFFKWEDYAMEVDLNDPFFQTLDVMVRVNADFANLPIYDVEVKLSYPYGREKPVEEFAFMKPDDVNRFRAFVADGVRRYKYVYQVNYKGDSRVFTSKEVETDDTQLTVNVDDLGILVVDIAPGDINFTQVKQAQIVVRYEDAGINPIERQFIMTPETNVFKIREVIYKARVKPIQYSVKYYMFDGRVYETKSRQQDAPQLYINDPFSAMKTVGLRAIGDLDARIQTIMVDLVYKDAANNYTQTHSAAMSREVPFFDWTFPVIDENAGELKYSGIIAYRNGTTQNIPETVATRSTIQLGDVVADRLEVTVIPDLIDFGAVKLVTVSLHYADAPNNVDERKTLTFRPGGMEQRWVVDQKDRAARGFTWSAVFYMADGSQKRVDDQPEQGSVVVLETPAD